MQIHADIHHDLDYFSKTNALPCSTLSEAGLLDKRNPYHVESKLCLVNFDKYILNLQFL